MDSNTSSATTPAGLSPWSAHTPQIAIPEHISQAGDDNLAGERLEHVAKLLPRYYHSASVVSNTSGDVYIFGGRVGNQFKNDTWVIKLAGDPDLPLEAKVNPTRLEVSATLLDTTGTTPKPRHWHQSALADGFLIVWGGSAQDESGRIFTDDNSLYLLDISTHHWNKLDIRPAPSARIAHAACICADQFLVFGGQSKPGEYLNDLWSLDLKQLTQGNPKWEQIAIAPESRSPSRRAGQTMVAYSTMLYMFGGCNEANAFNDTWCFDMNTRTWTKLSCTGPIPPPRFIHAVSLVGDVVFMFGGEGDDRRDLGDGWSFKIPEKRWYRFPSMNSEPLARGGHILATAQECVFLVGGVRGDGAEPKDAKKVYKLDINLIGYPEQGEEITIKTMPRIEQLDSTRLIDASEESNHIEGGLLRGFGEIAQDIGPESGTLRATSIEVEVDAEESELVAVGAV
ncbi:unnamed protein product [Rhizoctonia solani]|uniref:Tip elongation aberrant protein 1 n=1 Tax=Rhizoctonia solani TaxID=456999 RepID=A0A8H3GUC4_9AGAM|nr:unnamed protein product [Rhizoctonia solani]